MEKIIISLLPQLINFLIIMRIKTEACNFPDPKVILVSSLISFNYVNSKFYSWIFSTEIVTLGCTANLINYDI